MKLALVVYLAHWFAKRGTSTRGLWGGTLPFLVIAAPVVVLVLLEPDLGTSSVLAFTAFTMFFLAGANVLHLVGLGAAAVPAVALLFLQSYQMDRIAAWLDPWRHASGLGFQSVQGYLALALGGEVFIKQVVQSFVVDELRRVVLVQLRQIAQNFGLNVFHQRRVMPACDRVKDKNTPIAYRGMRAVTLAPKTQIRRQAMMASTAMPREKTRRLPR